MATKWRIAALMTGVVVAAAACGSSNKSSQSTPTTAAAGGSRDERSRLDGLDGLVRRSVDSQRPRRDLVDHHARPDHVADRFGVSRVHRDRAGRQGPDRDAEREGRIDGRQIKLDVVDDQSTPSGDATAAQDLISKGVFGVIGETPFLFGGYKPLQAAGVPVTGGGYDGPEWGLQPNTNMFSISGPVDPHYPANTGAALFMKNLGVSTVAAFG